MLNQQLHAYRQIAQLHDCGYSVTAELTADEAVQVTRKLADIAQSSPYKTFGSATRPRGPQHARHDEQDDESE